MTRRFQDASWWNDQVREHGFSPKSSDYSLKSHAIRLNALRTAIQRNVHIDSAKILDLPCGVGLLNHELLYPPRMYVGADFSTEALTVCKKEAKAQDAVLCVQLDLRDDTWPNRLRTDTPYDCVICSGLFCFDEIFKSAADTIKFVQKALGLCRAKAPLIANYPWIGNKESYCAGIQCYSIDELAPLCRAAGLSCQIEYGYLPHEFLATMRRNEE